MNEACGRPTHTNADLVRRDLAVPAQHRRDDEIDHGAEPELQRVERRTDRRPSTFERGGKAFYDRLVREQAHGGRIDR